jgi:hypothetical protein
LAALWTAARDRGRVASAAHEIELQLRTNPGEQGESRDEGRRILLVPPLATLFTVHEERTAVLVVAIWSFEKPAENS